LNIDDFDLVEGPQGQAALWAELARFAVTPSHAPITTITALFAQQAARTPDDIAVVQDGLSLTYQALQQASGRMASVLRDGGIGPGSFVGVMAEDAVGVAAALLAVLQAGAAYVPIDAALPFERLRFMLDDTGACALIAPASQVRLANRLQWECRALRVLLMPDAQDAHAQPEALGEKMRREVWDHVGATLFDDISGGGWQSSFTGQWLSREVMDDYGDNVRAKLAPWLTPSSRILEIGCASGISLVRLAPLVARYVGTDLSPAILGWTRAEVARRGLAHVRLEALAAHEIGGLEEGGFDVVVINSVLQCFSGHNYLRAVLRSAMALLGGRGKIFLGNVFDNDLKDAFLAELADYAAHRRAPGERTRVDLSEELFISRAFIEDLRHDLGGIERVEYSPLLTAHESELSRFTFDALLHVEKSCTVVLPARHKLQLDARHLAQVDLTALLPTPVSVGPQSPAYAIYTSGTAGRPKGVVVPHDAIVRLVVGADYVQLGPDTRVLMTGALSFDASTFEIWAPLLNGGSFCSCTKDVVLDPPLLAAEIRRWRVNTMWLTSSLCNQLIDADTSLFAPLQQLLVGGERLSPTHIATLRRAHPQLRVINGYGPTENTTFSTAYAVRGDEAGDIPIGRPIAGSEVIVVDASGAPVPVGVPGEVWVAGRGLALGYLNQPDLTAEKFRAHPLRPGERAYRTGDRGRWSADGQLHYLGRLDDQVKIRGFRIEPGEVELALRALLPDSDVVVTAPEAPAGQPRELVAYVTGDPDLVALRTPLQQRLPEYMVPTHVVVLERLPLTPNGKVDRRSLPPPRAASTPGVVPANDTERVLAAVWQEVLELPQVGVTDNFFDIGGHSLRILKLVTRIQQRLGQQVPIAAVFKAPTVRELASRLMDAAKFGVPLADETHSFLGGDPAGPALFALPPGTGDVFSYLPLASALPQYAWHAFNFIEAETRFDDYADAIAELAPPPYLLLGYSAGGNLAYHVASRLQARGLAVRALIMIDAGRTLAPYPYDEPAAVAATLDFMDDPELAPYFSNPVLRDKQLRRVLALYRFLSGCVDEVVVDADIEVLVGDPPQMERAHAGHTCVSIPAWSAVTRGNLRIHQGAGTHNHMLHPPALEANLATLQQVLSRLCGEQPSDSRLGCQNL
jgi:amino acid adenylation domain-containing protein